MEVFDIINDLFKAGTDRVAAVTRVGAVEGVKNDNVFVIVFKIALHHSQFVKVG